MRRRKAFVETTVVVEVNDEDVIKHLAFNCVANGCENLRGLDGWADLADDAATMYVERDTFECDVRPPSSTTNGGEDGG